MALKKASTPPAPKISNKQNQPGGSRAELSQATTPTNWRAFSQFRRYLWDFLGIAALVLAIATFFELFLPGPPQGVFMGWWIGQLRVLFGWGGLWVVGILGLAGYWLLRKQNSTGSSKLPWGNIIMLEAAAFASIALLSVLAGHSLNQELLSQAGGRVGWGLAETLRLVLSFAGLSGTIWQVLIWFMAFFICLVIGIGLIGPLIEWARRSNRKATDLTADLEPAAVVSEGPIAGTTAALDSKADVRKRKLNLPPQFRKSFQYEPDEDKPPVEAHDRDERLPPMETLISEPMTRPDERTINLSAGLIEKTLAEFGIPAKVIGFQVGPTVTQFAVEPGFVEKGNIEGEAKQKVRVSQIAGLSRDLALALSADRLRIEAPVPGRPYIGIEVPNSRSSMVRLRPILETEAFYKVNSPLAIALGRDVSGSPVVADLTRMPHLLIAGTTGSGKSVCIAAIATCLVMNNSPEDLRLVMADPKMVELVRFNGLPHLYGKVETDIERTMGVLRWVVAEMDRRYKLLEASRSRNIDSYNRKIRRRRGELPLPRIILFIDELADMMMTAPDQTEHNLIRLAQMARATGIHLIVATQRPSTDVVTGLIKANFPARISFAMASSIDSRVILDTVGAESLLGRGDMLYLPPEGPNPIRAQGVWVTDQEIERVITFWQRSLASPEVEPPPWEAMLQEEAMYSDQDELIQQAIEVVRITQRASASLLQRRLHIGYPRAARLIDELEEMGIIGPAQAGGREREVLIPSNKENEEEML